jgi:hypothetical protein
MDGWVNSFHAKIARRGSEKWPLRFVPVGLLLVEPSKELGIHREDG